MVNVREYSEGDRMDVLDLIVELQEFERKLEQDRLLGKQVADKYLNYLLNKCKNSNGKLLVAEINTDLIGFVSGWIIEDEEEMITTNKKYGYVSDLVVSEKYRNLKVGRELLEAVENHFGRLGVKVIKLNTLVKNQGMLSFLIKLGYRQYEVTSIKAP